jgi:hypothetical protein
VRSRALHGPLQSLRAALGPAALAAALGACGADGAPKVLRAAAFP